LAKSKICRKNIYISQRDNMLNPKLYGASQPMQIQGEHFLLTRRGMTCEITVPGLPTLRGSGELVLTTIRMVFIVTKKVALGDGMFFEAFDLPLTTLSVEKFNQPIFGANNLTGTVQPVVDGGLPGPATFKLTFREGGCGTFLHFFLRALRELRGGRGVLGGLASSGALRTESAAFVDPNDPTVIFVVQPVVPVAAVPVASYGPRAMAVVAPAPDYPMATVVSSGEKQ
jgi:hypothetical protein